MKNSGRRLFALLVCLMMTVTQMPKTAFAEGEPSQGENQTVEELPEEQTVPEAEEPEQEETTETLTEESPEETEETAVQTEETEVKEAEENKAEEADIKEAEPETSEEKTEAGKETADVTEEPVEEQIEESSEVLKVSEADAIAKIGDTYYETLTDAFYDAIDNGSDTTIELLKESEADFSWSYSYDQTADKHTTWYNNVIINGNGNKINWGNFTDNYGGVVPYREGTVYSLTVNNAEIAGDKNRDIEFANRPAGLKFNKCKITDFKIVSNLGYVNYDSLASEQLNYEFYDCELHNCDVWVYNGGRSFVMENCDTYDSVFQVWNIHGGKSKLSNVNYESEGGRGSGLLFWDCVNLDVSNLTLKDGLALLIERTTASIKDSDFSNNTGRTVSGYFVNTTSTYTGQQAVLGWSDVSGGSHKLTVKNTTIENNGTSSEPVNDTVYVRMAVTADFDNVDIKNNIGNNGGTVLENCGDTTFSQCEVTDNTVNDGYRSAGVFINSPAGDYTFTGTKISNNKNTGSYTVLGTGVGFWNGNQNGANITFSDCELKGNANESSNGAGGAIYYYNNVGSDTPEGELLIENSKVNENSTAGSGGGINYLFGKVTVKNSEINENRADADGGGIYTNQPNGTTLTVQDSVVESNTAKGNGGGIHMNGYESSSFSVVTVNIDGTKVNDNNAGGNGGGIYGRVSSAKGAEIKYNIAEGNGGGICAMYTADFTDAEIYNNAAAIGDDLYTADGRRVKMILPKTGDDWALETTTPDGETVNDCEDLIDGWYGDGNWTDHAADRKTYKLWDVHNDPTSALVFTRAVENEIETPGYTVALKAAHGLVLNIEKEIETDGEIDKNKAFTFTVTLPGSDRIYTGKNIDPEGTFTADNVSAEDISGSGEVTFDLKHGENMVLYGVSYDALCTVKEEAAEGYYNKAPGKDTTVAASEYVTNVKYVNTPLNLFTDLAASESGTDTYDTEHTAKYDVTDMSSVDLQLEIDLGAYKEILENASSSGDAEAIKKEIIEEIKTYYRSAYPSFSPTDSQIEDTLADVDFDAPYETKEAFTVTITLTSDLSLPSDASSYELDTDALKMAVSGNTVTLTLNDESNSAELPAVVVLTIKDVDVSEMQDNTDYAVAADTKVTGGTLEKTISVPAFPGRQIPPYPAIEKSYSITLPDATAVQNLNSETYGDGTDFVLVGNNDDGITQLTLTRINIDIKVRKVDEDGKALSGAKLAVKDSSGEIVDQWTTDGKDHQVEGLLPDSTYTLTELSAPEGYQTAADIVFTTNEDGRVQILEMVDKKTGSKHEDDIDVKVRKVDDQNRPVSGAVLAVKDSSGEIIDQWTTDGSDHQVKGLLPGSTYTLTEIKAPAGYQKAAEITFTTGSENTSKIIQMVDKKMTVRKTSAPKTNDRNDMAGWGMAAGVSVLMAVLAAILKKRLA